MQADHLFVAQHLDPGESVRISPHGIEYASEIGLEAAAAFLEKVREQKRHFMRAQRPLLRVEQFVPSFLRRRILERTRHKLVPRIQIVSAWGSNRTSKHVKQH